jgi:hypothetical protein
VQGKGKAPLEGPTPSSGCCKGKAPTEDLSSSSGHSATAQDSLVTGFMADARHASTRPESRRSQTQQEPAPSSGGECQMVVSCRKWRRAPRPMSPPPPCRSVPMDLVGRCFNCFLTDHVVARCSFVMRYLHYHREGHNVRACKRPRSSDAGGPHVHRHCQPWVVAVLNPWEGDVALLLRHHLVDNRPPPRQTCLRRPPHRVLRRFITSPLCHLCRLLAPRWGLPVVGDGLKLGSSLA